MNRAEIDRWKEAFDPSFTQKPVTGQHSKRKFHRIIFGVIGFASLGIVIAAVVVDTTARSSPERSIDSRYVVVGLGNEPQPLTRDNLAKVAKEDVWPEDLKEIAASARHNRGNRLLNSTMGLILGVVLFSFGLANLTVAFAPNQSGLARILDIPLSEKLTWSKIMNSINK